MKTIGKQNSLNTYNILLFTIFKCRNTHKVFLIVHNPKATIKQNPILGRNNILSATTKPTLKNRFEAGKNEKVAMASDSDNNFETGPGKKTDEPVKHQEFIYPTDSQESDGGVIHKATVNQSPRPASEEAVQLQIFTLFFSF